MNSKKYYPTEIRLTIGREPWYRNIVNRGFKYFEINDDTGEYELVNAKDEKGEEASEPALLKEDGTKLPKGVVGNSIAYRTRKEANYNNLEQLIYSAGEAII